ncbi:hypothetical protein BZA70DRAFT_86341 [Myxozyma melibiosi]|uniref:Rad60/SUMO-like domain-containing protein n=1 Tax=Myxozyma melibiosi TaxID=54550 RepID=A0ABR1EZ60_9ASCO
MMDNDGISYEGGRSVDGETSSIKEAHSEQHLSTSSSSTTTAKTRVKRVRKEIDLDPDTFFNRSNDTKQRMLLLKQKREEEKREKRRKKLHLQEKKRKKEEKMGKKSSLTGDDIGGIKQRRSSTPRSEYHSAAGEVSDSSDVLVLEEISTPQPVSPAKKAAAKLRRKKEGPKLSPPPGLTRGQIETMRHAMGYEVDDYVSLPAHHTRSTTTTTETTTVPRVLSPNPVVFSSDEEDGGNTTTNNPDGTVKDLLPEIAARARERARQIAAAKASEAGTQRNKHSGFNVLISVATTDNTRRAFEAYTSTGDVVGAMSLNFTLKSGVPLRRARIAWARRCGVDENRVRMLNRATFMVVYDSSTAEDLGVTEDDPQLGLAIALEEEIKNLQVQHQMQLEQELLADDEDDDAVPVLSAKQRQTSVAASETDARPETEAETEDEGKFKIFLQDGKGERIVVRVRGESSVADIVKYYRSRRPELAAGKTVVLSLDDDDLDPAELVKDTELEDEVTIDVKLR